MSYRAFRIIEFLMVVILVVLIKISVDRGIAWIPIPAFIIAVMIMFLLRRRIKEVVTDERVDTIASKAASITFQAGAVIMAAVGVTLEALSHNHPELRPYGDALIFSTGGLMMIYILGTLYYSGKLGGGGVRA